MVYGDYMRETGNLSFFLLAHSQMTFIQQLLESGYVFDNEDYDGCYVKQDVNNFIHLYQEGEDEGEWNYVKMTEEFDVITEVTFNPDSNTVIS